MIPAEKKCSTCKKLKPAGRFARRIESRDGLHSQCYDCQAEYRRLKRQALKPTKPHDRPRNEENAGPYIIAFPLWPPPRIPEILHK
jgi:hypothetical protein